jgi:hypothetical protein
MVITRSIQFKAAIMLFVFSLNTAVGFACAVGVDMGFNSKGHHDEQAAPTVHVHADGKKHLHNKNNGHAHDKKGHSHAASHETKDNCCKGKVVKLEQGDKSRPATIFGLVIPPAYSVLPVSFYQFNVSIYHPDIEKDVKQFVRCHHPPIPDIRIAIQSFQI